MSKLFVALSVLSLLAAIAGGFVYGPVAAERERSFQKSLDELKAHHAEVKRLEVSTDPADRAKFEAEAKLFEEEEAALRPPAKLVAQSKFAFGGSLIGGVLLAGVFAFMAKQRRAPAI